MYYPYLRARQFELISLRELVLDNTIQTFVTPILEPVKEGFGNLDLAFKVFTDYAFSAYLIVNPFQGDIKGDFTSVLDYISGKGDVFLPAFHYSNNAEYITNCIDQYNLTNAMIICLDSFVDDEGFRALCSCVAVSQIVILDPKKNRGLDRFIKESQKKYVRLDDVFEKKSKNADFLDIPAHKFTEEHLYYADEGYYGFSDFTILPKEFIDGGSTPRAVVIHLSYLNAKVDNQIWIRHFTSNTNDTIANVQGKFGEAAKKALEFCTENNLNNSAIQELRYYYDEGKYPGLGTVKKISLKNHLIIVSNFLRDK